MSVPRRLSRRLALMLVAPLVVVAAAGCGSTSDTSSADSAPKATATTSSVAADAFPVTIKSALGTATIETEPKRVATWGWSTQDAVLALGVVPVAMPANTYGGNKDKVLPWDAEAITALHGSTPQLLGGGDTGEVPFEQIAAARPDVILAPYSGLTQAEYDKLSAIAPVVAYPDKPWATSWQEQTTIVGKALGRSEQAAALITTTDEQIARLGAAHPELAGKSFLYASANEAGKLNIFRASDPRVQLLTQLGLTPSASIADLDAHPDQGSYFYQVSNELVGKIDADLLVAYFDTQKAADDFAAQPAIAAIPAVRDGHFAPIVGESYVMASSAPTALSIPWMLKDYVPQLAAHAG